MILINLLPHRAEKRRLRKRAFFMTLGASALVGAVIAGLWYSSLQYMTHVQRQRNAFLSGETAKLEAQIKDIANLRAEIEGLQARQGAVEALQANRNVPVYLLDELVRRTPEGIQLVRIQQTDDGVTVSGRAQTNERVSEMLRNVQNESPWLLPPDLIEIRAVNLNPTTGSAGASVVPGDVRRLFEFSLRVKLRQPGEAAAAPVTRPASAPAARKAQAKAKAV